MEPVSLFRLDKTGGIFLCALILVCQMVAMIVPPLQSPDENDHLTRAMLLANGQLILDTAPGQSSGGFIDSGLKTFMDTFRPYQIQPELKMNESVVENAHAIAWSHQNVYVPAPGTGYYLPLAYAPTTLGMMAGKFMGLSVADSYSMARFTTLLGSTAVLALAFALNTPSALVLALLTLPMCLFQLGSTSLDGMVNALTVLALSVFWRASSPATLARAPWLFGLLLGTCFLAAASKLHLAVLLVLPLHLGMQSRSRQRLIWSVLAAGAVLLWVLLALASTVDLRTAGSSGAASKALYYAQHPLDLVWALAGTVSRPRLLGRYLLSFVGYLGWLDVKFSLRVYAVMLALLLGAALMSVDIKLRQDAPVRRVLAACAVSSGLLVLLLLLVTWNEAPADFVDGVQGRYFFCPALMLAYAVSPRQAPPGRRRLLGLALAAGLLLFSAAQTNQLVLKRYHTPGWMSPGFN